MTAEQAIARSASHTEIVRIFADADDLETLTSECEDSAELGDRYEFWGATLDGAHWRVHAVPHVSL